MDSDQPVLNDSDDRSHNDNSDGGQNGKFPFPTPKLFGKQRGRGVAIHLPVSATDFLMRVFLDSCVLEFRFKFSSISFSLFYELVICFKVCLGIASFSVKNLWFFCR